MCAEPSWASQDAVGLVSDDSRRFAHDDGRCWSFDASPATQWWSVTDGRNRTLARALIFSPLLCTTPHWVVNLTAREWHVRLEWPPHADERALAYQRVLRRSSRGDWVVLEARGYEERGRDDVELVVWDTVYTTCRRVSQIVSVSTADDMDMRVPRALWIVAFALWWQLVFGYSSSPAWTLALAAWTRVIPDAPLMLALGVSVAAWCVCVVSHVRTKRFPRPDEWTWLQSRLCNQAFVCAMLMLWWSI